MRYRFIAEQQQEYPVSVLCAALDVSVSGYYAWRSRGPSQRQQDDQRLGAQIAQVFRAGRGVYGSPRVHARLQAAGMCCGRKRVARLMQEQGLAARRPRHTPRTTDSQHTQPVAPNVLARDFCATAPQPEVGRRHHRHRDALRLALPGGHPRWVCPARRRLGDGSPAR
jgi:putative transposase